MNKYTKEQQLLINELKQQGAEHSIITWALLSLKTKIQINEMMDYLISIREKHIPKGKVISKIDEISKNN